MGTASCIRKHECVSRASSFSTWLACWLALQTATDSLEIKRCCLWRKTAADLWDKSCRTKPPTRFHWSVTLYKIQSFQMLLTLWFPEDDTAGSWSQWHQRRRRGSPALFVNAKWWLDEGACIRGHDWRSHLSVIWGVLDESQAGLRDDVMLILKHYWLNKERSAVRGRGADAD